MPTTTRLHTLSIDAKDSVLVERDERGLPTAFRIWDYGRNDDDGGYITFSEFSASKVLEEQTARGRLYSFDFNHLSLSKSAPPESTRAAGWHRLEVRPREDGKPTLWAVGCEWSPDVADGFLEQPPRWRYFSPAFMTEGESNQVVGYINSAICINPLTHGLPSLASRTSAIGDFSMDPKQALAVLLSPDATDDEKKAAAAVLADCLDHMSGSESAPAPEQQQEAESDEETDQMAAGEDESDEPPTKVAKAKAMFKAKTNVLNENLNLRRRLDTLEKESMLNKRPDLSSDMKHVLMTKSCTFVREYLSMLPKGTAIRKSSITHSAASATVDSTQIDPSFAAIDNAFAPYKKKGS